MSKYCRQQSVLTYLIYDFARKKPNLTPTQKGGGGGEKYDFQPLVFKILYSADRASRYNSNK